MPLKDKRVNRYVRSTWSNSGTTANSFELMSETEITGFLYMSRRYCNVAWLTGLEVAVK